jgi:ethanolamine utilization protein EutN
MQLARVLGPVWATVRHPPLREGRLLMLQGVDETLAADGQRLAALDTVGAGPGDLVLYVTAFEATIPWRERHPEWETIAVDAAVVAIVDRIDRGTRA